MTSLPAPLRRAALGLIVVVSACDGGGSCGDSLAASAPCPGQVYGYAWVNGAVLDADSAPAVGKTVYLNCEGDVVTGDVTDGEGRFVVRPVFATYDTTTIPPRAVDGSFDLPCEANSRIRPDVVVRESLLVPFAPTEADVAITLVILQEPAP